MNTQTIAQTAESKTRLRTGYIITGLTVLFLLVDSVVKLLQLTPALEATSRLGYPQHLVLGLGILEFLCLLVHIIPRTSILGAILLTAYLGGATATHVRIGDPFFFPVVVGVLVWGGLFLRDNRLRLSMLYEVQ